MLINASDDWFYLDEDGNVVEGDEQAPEGASSLLVAAGGQLDDDVAEAHGITDRLTPSSGVTMTHGVTGEEMFLKGNRAVAGHLLAQKPGASRHAKEGGVVVAKKEKKKVVEVEARAPAPEAKHISGPGETKSAFAQPTSKPANPAPADPANK